MPDDFGTLSVQGVPPPGETEAMRQRYQQQREILEKLTREAPTAQLAAEYRRLQRKIDESLRNLSDYERETRPAAGPATPASGPGQAPAAPLPVSPGQRILSGLSLADTTLRDAPPVRGGLGVPAMAAIAAVVLAGLGLLVWQSSKQGPKETSAAAAAATARTVAAARPPAMVTAMPSTAAAEPLSKVTVSPALADYGRIRRGTRAVRQFEVRNGGGLPAQIKVNRSSCRCLYYEYVETIPGKGKETLTVTVDGARARAGTLDETVQVLSKKDSGPLATFAIRATIR
jgi:Protein of unknown function (DUF1573)